MTISINRRDILLGATGAVALMATSRPVFAQNAAPGPFQLPPLPYAANVLEPHIDAQTMELHHDKHHAAYVSNLNAAAKEAPQIADHPLDHLIANLNSVPESVRLAVRNNLGGHVNHSIFWQIMAADGGKAEGELLAAITRDLGGVDKMKSDFNAAGGRVFGSGWAFVTVTGDGKLAIETRPNQDTPLMEGKRVLFGNDVWEHAYYLHYQNRRADYMKAWWNVVNWPKLADRYAQAKKGELTI